MKIRSLRSLLLPSRYRMHARASIVATAAFVIVLQCFCPRSRAEVASAASPNALVRQVVSNELKAEDRDHSHWMFRLEVERPNAQQEVDEVIETKGGDLKRPILINGRKLTSQEQRQRVEQLVRNPKALRKSLKDKNQDAARSQQLLKMLPDAFVFSYGERRGDLVQLKFTPDPHFRPPNREGAVFHAMAGNLWVDSKQLRVTEIAGHLLYKVKFGGGLLGHLDKGGEFDVKQTEVAPGYWELTVLNVQMTGKALFFKSISVQQKYSRSDFRQVPDDLTVAQGADMLRSSASTATPKLGFAAKAKPALPLFSRLPSPVHYSIAIPRPVPSS